MQWPKLVPPRVCNADIQVCITQGVNPDGSPREIVAYQGMCNYSEKAKQILDAERRMITLTGAALIDGDICPGQEQIEGYALVNGGSKRRLIHLSSRARNPDNTVNYTRLDLL